MLAPQVASALYTAMVLRFHDQVDRKGLLRPAQVEHWLSPAWELAAQELAYLRCAERELSLIHI